MRSDIRLSYATRRMVQLTPESEADHEMATARRRIYRRRRYCSRRRKTHTPQNRKRQISPTRTVRDHRKRSLPNLLAGGCLSPAYNNGRTRLGCWFCHNQRVNELRRLRKEHPELWARLLELDAVSPVRFTQRATVQQFDERFATEDAQLSIFDFIDKEVHD